MNPSTVTPDHSYAKVNFRGVVLKTGGLKKLSTCVIFIPNSTIHSRETMTVAWISDLTVLSIDFLTILFLLFLLSSSFDWKRISNTQDSVWSHFQTPRLSSKILRYAFYFQLSSQCLVIRSNTVFRVWYITSKRINMKLLVNWAEQICRIKSLRDF